MPTIYRIHIPKTAGISLQWATAELNRRGGHIRKPRGYIHGYLRQYPELSDCLVMSCVRNPWDRFLSLCEHERRQGDHDMSFEDYAKACRDKREQHPEVLDAVIPNDGPRPRGHALVLTSNRHWLVYDPSGPVHCDHLLRFENLAGDWRAFCDLIGVYASLPKLNMSPVRRDYRLHYTDTIRDIVDPVFMEDTHAFGYTFDPPGPGGGAVLRAGGVDQRPQGGHAAGVAVQQGRRGPETPRPAA